MVVAVVVIEQTQEDVAVDIMVSRDVLLDSLEYLCLVNCISSHFSSKTRQKCLLMFQTSLVFDVCYYGCIDRTLFVDSCSPVRY